jgi:hypothetical protein
MTLFIPLGSACLVRQSIDKYFNCGRATNLFDWNITNFKTVLYIIQNIDKPFIANDFHDMNQICPTNHRMINHNKVSFMIIHDFPTDKTYDEYMPEFLEKYNRRKERLKETILLKNKNIHFIHFLDVNTGGSIYIPTLYQLCEFYNALREINPDCKAHLHLLVHPDHINKTEEIDKLLVSNYIHVYYMKRMYNSPPEVNETIRGENWNWDEIYNSIKYMDEFWM